MPIQYRVLTANCANDTIGARAVGRIVEQFKQDSADFYIINCQEVSFSKTLKQLRDQAGDLLITCCGYMPTHTKLATQFHADTGIGTFILHKKEIHVVKKSTAVIRRNPTRISGGSGYNKGGILSKLSVSKDNETIDIQAISAHLDSHSAQKRSIDWQNIHEARRFEPMESIEELTAAYPMITALGIDANTRNKISNAPVNPWDDPAAHLELASMHQAPIGIDRFSNESTYKEYERPKGQTVTVTTRPDKKRVPYAVGGSLDHVFISGGASASESVSLFIDPHPDDSKRDHTIILSPLQILKNSKNIRNLMAEDLRHASPSLARQLEDRNVLIDDETLLLIHNRLLSKEGLLQKMIGLHARKLALNQRLKHMTLSTEVSTQMSALLFPTTACLENISLDSLDEKLSSYESQVALMSSLLTIVEKYPLNETLISAFITNNLKLLSHEVSSRASPGWKKLGYSCMALGLSAALLGIVLSVPTFGISLIIPIALALSGIVSALAGHILYSASKEHGLAKAISDDTQTLEGGASAPALMG